MGAAGKIGDPVSAVFARVFYARLLKGDTIGEAVRKARLGVVKRCGAQSLAWANYILYGAPDFVLFKPCAKVRPSMVAVARDSIKMRKDIWQRGVRYIAVMAACVGLCWGFWQLTPGGICAIGRPARYLHRAITGRQ